MNRIDTSGDLTDTVNAIKMVDVTITMDVMNTRDMMNMVCITNTADVTNYSRWYKYCQ